jgi:hypothetical protein
MNTPGHLQPASQLVGCMLHAVDGEIGALEALYFDDAGWMVRYLLVDSGDWLAGRRVLISPVAVGELSLDNKTIYIELTRRQIEDSPPLDADQPVSRSYEAVYYKYYGWPAYWEDGQSGVRLSTASSQTWPSSGEELHTSRKELRLQGTSGLNGCVIVAHDGAIGQIRDLIVDTRYWVIRYLAIETHTGQSGRLVLVSPCWIERVSRGDHLMNIGLTSTAIDSAPTFDPCAGISRDYEARLFKHYRRRGYWQRNNGMN